MRPWHILLSILVPAVLTFGLRALPFLLLNKRELPKRIEYLGNVFPMAIMATLVVYCLKSVPASVCGRGGDGSSPYLEKKFHSEHYRRDCGVYGAGAPCLSHGPGSTGQQRWLS